VTGLRLAGILVALLAVGALARRRRSGALLGRLELLGFPAAVALATVSIQPAAADWLVGVTGLTGELSRITSLLVVGVLALAVVVLQQQSAIDRTKGLLLAWLRQSVAESVAKGEPVEVIVVLPAWDEAENLPAVLARAPAEVEGHSLRCLVVDDGSTDGTADVARAHGAHAVRTPINVGGGHALQVGFAAAERLGARWVVTMDADGQHDFADLPALLAPLFAGEADLVIGSRRLGASVGHAAARSLGLSVFNALLSFLTGRRITDCSSGFRAFDLARLRSLRLLQDRHHTAEAIIEASRRGLRLVERPITIRPRLHGESKKGVNWLYGARFARTVLATWWRS
jgi:hypothetical protein